MSTQGRHKSCSAMKKLVVEGDIQSSGAAAMPLDSIRPSMFDDTLRESGLLLPSRADERTDDREPVRDEEERDLLRQLDILDCERRKERLRATLSAKMSKRSDDSDSDGHARTSRSKKSRKHRKRATLGSSSSDSCRTTSSSSSSSSASDSSASKTRRRRRHSKKKNHSKYSLHGFTRNKKSVKKLNFSELLYASLLWGVKRARKVGMNMADLQNYIGHLCYMTMHATTNTFTDEAFRGYDRAIREKVKEKGIKCFKMGDNNVSLLHFNLDNARSIRDVKRPMYSSAKKYVSNFSKPRRGLCYAHNFDKSGCTKKDCDWDHKCVSCRSSDHVVSSCPNKKN